MCLCLETRQSSWHQDLSWEYYYYFMMDFTYETTVMFHGFSTVSPGGSEALLALEGERGPGLKELLLQPFGSSLAGVFFYPTWAKP